MGRRTSFHDKKLFDNVGISTFDRRGGRNEICRKPSRNPAAEVKGPQLVRVHCPQPRCNVPHLLWLLSSHRLNLIGWIAGSCHLPPLDSAAGPSPAPYRWDSELAKLEDGKLFRAVPKDLKAEDDLQSVRLHLDRENCGLFLNNIFFLKVLGA
ncbi:Hypothetical protein NTJ_10782 [Nesidiocoris tenuis]|uniref:Uncharacterized protein n=1 Tax=Nesidiocoris tenuis TaxID=355587 RepID=A0ABN7B2X1_9HEMI|nr:Hypothetical protein NTJ_10782 [Nesidiocoris tenuis]